MSKTKWGAALSFFIGVIANFAPIPEAWRWGLTALAILGLIICGVGYLVSKPEQLKQTTAVSGSVFTADVSGHVVTAGRDAIQIVIGRSGEPSNTPSDVLLSSQMQELRELQEFIGVKTNLSYGSFLISIKLRCLTFVELSLRLTLNPFLRKKLWRSTNSLETAKHF